MKAGRRRRLEYLNEKGRPKAAFFLIWRRGGDSNPRGAINACLISSQVHSTALPPLQMVPANRGANDKGHWQCRQGLFHSHAPKPPCTQPFRQPARPATTLAVHVHERDDALPSRRTWLTRASM